jgi:hypothetical protein
MNGSVRLSVQYQVKSEGQFRRSPQREDVAMTEICFISTDSTSQCMDVGSQRRHRDDAENESSMPSVVNTFDVFFYKLDLGMCVCVIY